MSFNMCCEVTFIRKSFWTYITCKRLLSCVGKNMLFKCPLSRKSSAAIITFKHSDIQMCTKMIFKVTISSKSRTATLKFARVRFFPWMNSHMDFQISFFVEFSSTFFTEKRLLSLLKVKLKLTWVLLWILSLYRLIYFLLHDLKLHLNFFCNGIFVSWLGWAPTRSFLRLELSLWWAHSVKFSLHNFSQRNMDNS